MTALNLIPIGQLDGGHVAYALFGQRQRTLALIAIPILLFLGFTGWPGWILWAGLAGFVGLSHPPVVDPLTTLGKKRMWVAWGALAIFVLSFFSCSFLLLNRPNWPPWSSLISLKKFAALGNS